MDTATNVVKGIAQGCEQSNCALIGGETAEMPSMYPDGEYDLAGFAVGAVEKSKIINGSTIAAGDVVLGLGSNGVHSNGFSLVRKVLEVSKADLSMPMGDVSLQQAISAPTRIYVKPILAALKHINIKGMAHITGGGLTENVPRVLPEGLQAVIHSDSWTRPPLFQWLQSAGNISDDEMHRVFNCGIGMVVIVAAQDAEKTREILAQHGEQVFTLGEIRALPAGEAPTIVI